MNKILIEDIFLNWMSIFLTKSTFFEFDGNFEFDQKMNSMDIF